MTIELTTSICLVLLGLALLLAVIRIVLGPTLADRILGLDTATVIGVGIIAAFAVRTDLYLYADLAIALALIGFLSTAALARYLLARGTE